MHEHAIRRYESLQMLLMSLKHKNVVFPSDRQVLRFCNNKNMGCTQHVLVLLVISLLFTTYLLRSRCVHDEGEQVYIVYMGDQVKEQLSTESHYDVLKPVLGHKKARDSLVYSYRNFNGLAVRLTQREKEKLEAKEGIISMFPSRILKPHTTNSWDFLAFSEPVERNHVQERDVIVGVIDSGIWPELESFDDEGIAEPPTRWRGKCSANFTCNNKIIGARYYNSLKDFRETDDKSPRDTLGHGSHTAATAAGRRVENAGLNGVANGTARGAVPSARIAVYKVCWEFGCAEQDVLAAFDDAIKDGVDVISVSIGGDRAREFFDDSVAIGSFHAMKNGILTSASAGNNGPGYGTVVNVAPWLLSTAATNTNRRIVSKLMVGDETFVGAAVNAFETSIVSYPVISYSDPMVSIGSDEVFSEYGFEGKYLKGKIALLYDWSYNYMSRSMIKSGVHGVVITSTDINSQYAKVYPLPATSINDSQRATLLDLLNRTGSSMAKILKSESILEPNLEIGLFSSRGPNPIIPDILKPDISAPGVEILSAWSPMASLSGFSSDKRAAKFNILTGTSMACPHTTGAAAYVKSIHPTWPPSAITSALITTAKPVNSRNPLEAGAGLINPAAAVNPGLLYEATVTDYVRLLCNKGYSNKQLDLITGTRNTSCIRDGMNHTIKDFNHPSMSFYQNKSVTPFTVHFPRTVTNVGKPHSLYKATVSLDDDKLIVTVNPKSLSFNSIEEKLNFTVTVSSPKGLKMGSVASGSILWFDGEHIVRSPIVVSVGTLGFTSSF